MKLLVLSFTLMISTSILACSGDKKESDKGKPKTDQRIEYTL